MDIATTNGDLSLIRTAEEEYDLALFKGVDVKRALETPQTYIKEWSLEGELMEIDGEFGNPIYSKAHEPLSLEWLKEVQADIRTALSFLDQQIIVNYVGVNSELDKVEIEVDYQLNQQNLQTTLQLPLS